ncbi:SGTA homodimerization domain [Trinorchestia longiramus]|nr:SGTA homodimerization domain [Trinorchestia longiramus]
MSRSVAKQLVHSIVEFLRSELAHGEAALGAESAESVEVAVQCLETAYNLPASPAPSVNLYELFSDASSTSQQCSSRSAPTQEAGGAAGFAPTDEDKAHAEQFKMEGNTRMKEGSFAASIQCYTKAIEKDPSNAVYYCNRAAAHSKTENHSAAIEDCKKALQLEPNYGKAYGRMGLAYSSLGELQEACNCYRRAVELEPENESYASNLSIAEEKLASSSQQQQPANPLAGLLSGGGGLAGLAGAFNSSGTPDLSGLLANPALMNVATQLMSDPNMQNM